MRRVLALALLGLSTFAGSAAADPTCAHGGFVALCVEYVCVEICGPELHVDPQCSNPPSPLLQRMCDAIDSKYYVL